MASTINDTVKKVSNEEFWDEMVKFNIPTKIVANWVTKYEEAFPEISHDERNGMIIKFLHREGSKAFRSDVSFGKIPDFVFVSKSGSEYVDGALLAEYVRKFVPYKVVRSTNRLGAMFYVYENGCYHIYSPDMFKGVIKQQIAEYKPRLVTMRSVDEAYKQIVTDLNFVDIEELNSDESIINFENGILKISADSMEFSPHSRSVLSTIQLPLRWTDEAIETPIFDRFLNTLTSGNKDIQKLLLQFMGVAFSNVRGYRMKKALFLYGPGNSGKSQIKALTEKILGSENFVGIDLSTLEARFGTNQIYGKRLAGSSDMSYASLSELKIFKQLTGGDSVQVEFKGKDGFSFTYHGLLWFCMNKLPKFSGDTGEWVYNRFIPIPCNNVIPADEQDKLLLDRMFKERQGIVQKCVKALQEVIRNGYNYTEPDFVVKQREQYMEINSTVLSFWHDCMVITDTPHIQKKRTHDIYRMYSSWCDDNNNGYRKSEREFQTELCEFYACSWSDMTIRTNKGIVFKEWNPTEDCINDYFK